MVPDFSDGISSCSAPQIKSWGGGDLLRLQDKFTSGRPHCSGVEVLSSTLLPQPPVSSHLISFDLGRGQQQAMWLGAACWLAELAGAAPGLPGGSGCCQGCRGAPGSGRAAGGGLGLPGLLLLRDRRAGMLGYVHALWSQGLFLWAVRLVIFF